ncbi:MAG: ABC transporter permease [Acidimicrobiia bacterium]|nr:ABC transporter permease [Acidimicrobiia bacterium]
MHADAFFTGGLPVRFLLSAAHFDALVGGTGQEFLVLVKASAGRADEVREAAEAALADFPNVEVFSRDEYRRQAERSIDVFLAVMLALLLLAVVIAVLGIVNTLVLSVVERTRELGLLRVVGMSRRQTRAMVRAEAVVVALMGGVLGVAIGLLWAWAMTEALRDQGISVMDVPVLQLLGFVALSAVSGVAAAVFPARRAARLDVLEAIAEE